MTAKVYAIVAATVLAIGTGTALARPAVSPLAQYDRATLTARGTPLQPYDPGSVIAMKAAFVGDGTNGPARQPFQYNYGCAAANVGDGSSPSTLGQQQELSAYQYNFGGAAAHVGDGSSSSYQRQQRELLNEPGYSIGTGAARVSGG